MSLITKLGKQKLEEKLESLKEEYKITLVNRGVAAREGDLKENAAYISLGEKAIMLSSQIDEATSDLKQAEIAPIPTQKEIIAFGHQIKLRYENDQREITVTLVGKNDARLKPDWISYECPLGQALIGKKAGDKVMVNDQPVTILHLQIGEIE